MKFWKLISTALFIFSLTTTALADPAIGAAAPNFSVKDVSGAAQSVAQYKGKFIVLEWFNHDCPFVKKHYNSGNMQATQKEFVGKGVVWLSINSNALGKQGHRTPLEARTEAGQKNWAGSAIILDEDGHVGKLYGARTTPHMFIIDPKGSLVYAGAIDSDNSSREDAIKGATNYVKAALDEALAGKAVTNASTEPYGCSVKYAG